MTESETNDGEMVSPLTQERTWEIIQLVGRLKDLPTLPTERDGVDQALLDSVVEAMDDLLSEAMRANVEVATSRLQWTTDPPEEAGWYWAVLANEDADHIDAIIVEVICLTELDWIERYCVWHDQRKFEMEAFCRWAGPIKGPSPDTWGDK